MTVSCGDACVEWERGASDSHEARQLTEELALPWSVHLPRSRRDTMLLLPRTLPCRLQDLANHAASLNSTRGAAFGFASIAKLAGEQLKPYVDKVVPKLYRCGFPLIGRICSQAYIIIFISLIVSLSITFFSHLI